MSHVCLFFAFEFLRVLHAKSINVWLETAWCWCPSGCGSFLTEELCAVFLPSEWTSERSLCANDFVFHAVLSLLLREIYFVSQCTIIIAVSCAYEGVLLLCAHTLILWECLPYSSTAHLCTFLFPNLVPPSMLRVLWWRWALCSAHSWVKMLFLGQLWLLLSTACFRNPSLCLPFWPRPPSLLSDCIVFVTVHQNKKNVASDSSNKEFYYFNTSSFNFQVSTFNYKYIINSVYDIQYVWVLHSLFICVVSFITFTKQPSL